MSEKIIISDNGEYVSRKINISDTVRLGENMPSVSSILYKNISCAVTESSVKGNTLYLSGSIFAEIIYISEAGYTERFSFSLPFDATGPTRADEGVFTGKGSVCSADIIPVKGRRLDVNVSVEVTGYVFGRKEISPVPHDENFIVCTDSEERKVSLVSKETFSETYSVSHPSGIGEGAKIIYADAEVFDIKTNHSPAGILVNGFIRQNIIYSKLDDDDSFNYFAITENTAFSRFCEVGYDVSFDDYTVVCSVTGTDAYIRKTDSEESIFMDITVLFDITLLKENTALFISDIFSPDMSLKCDMESVMCCVIRKILHKEINLKAVSSIDFKNPSVRLIPAGCNMNVMCFPENGRITAGFFGNAECIVMLPGNGRPEVIGFLIDERIGYDCDCIEDGRYFAVYNINEMVSSMTNSEARLSLPVTVDIYGIYDELITQTGSMTFSEYPPSAEDTAKISVFYHTAPQDIFSIAKSTRKTPQAVSEILSALPENSPLIIWDGLD